jgi:hypothetical protein
MTSAPPAILQPIQNANLSIRISPPALLNSLRAIANSSPASYGASITREEPSCIMASSQQSERRSKPTMERPYPSDWPSMLCLRIVKTTSSNSLNLCRFCLRVQNHWWWISKATLSHGLRKLSGTTNNEAFAIRCLKAIQISRENLKWRQMLDGSLLPRRKE